jgi:hypothetical protein
VTSGTAVYLLDSRDHFSFCGSGFDVHRKTYGRFGVSASRAEKPKDFWGAVAIYYLSGVLFIGYFFYEVHQLSN